MYRTRRSYMRLLTRVSSLGPHWIQTYKASNGVRKIVEVRSGCSSNGVISWEQRAFSVIPYHPHTVERQVETPDAANNNKSLKGRDSQGNNDSGGDGANPKPGRACNGRVLLAFSLFGLFGGKSLRDRIVEDTKEKYTQDTEQPKLTKFKIPGKYPVYSKEIPFQVPYLIVGGGTAACAAFQTLQELQPSARILVVSSEPYYPYKRPPLSKEMWFREKPPSKFKLISGRESNLFFQSPDSYTECRNLMKRKEGGVAVARGWRVERIDVANRTVFLNDGHPIEFDKCLIATGCSPKKIPCFTSESPYVKERVSFFFDISDYQQVEKALKGKNKNIVIIGGGTWGSELACSLAYRERAKGVLVTQVFSESGHLRKLLPEYLSNWTTKKMEEEGIRVIPNSSVKSVSADNGLTLHLNTGEDIYADHVILAMGCVPNTQFAQSSNLEIDSETGGFVVNSELMARSNVWVAGDCCSFFDSKLGRIRMERFDHAIESGRLAAENMIGGSKPYEHHSIFWSDLGPKFGYEAVGLIDARLPTVGVFTTTSKGFSRKVHELDSKRSRVSNASEWKHEDFSKGIIFYLQQGVVVGVLLWNVYGQLATARQIVAEGRREEELDDVVKLFTFAEEKTSPHLDDKMYDM